MKNRIPFVIATVLWIAAAAVFCWKTASFPGQASTSVKWLVGLSILSLLDLLALAQVMKGAIGLMDAKENRFFSAIRTSYWGTLKLACIVIFGIVFWKIGNSRAAVPAAGVLAGVSTLVVVPLLGGLIHHFLNSDLKTDLRSDYGRACV